MIHQSVPINRLSDPSIQRFVLLFGDNRGTEILENDQCERIFRSGWRPKLDPREKLEQGYLSSSMRVSSGNVGFYNNRKPATIYNSIFKLTYKACSSF